MDTRRVKGHKNTAVLSFLIYIICNNDIVEHVGVNKWTFLCATLVEEGVIRPFFRSENGHEIKWSKFWNSYIFSCIKNFHEYPYVSQIPLFSTSNSFPGFSSLIIPFLKMTYILQVSKSCKWMLYHFSKFSQNFLPYQEVYKDSSFFNLLPERGVTKNGKQSGWGSL